MLQIIFGILKYSENKLHVHSKILQTNYDSLTRSSARSMTTSVYMMKTAAMLIYRQQSVPQGVIPLCFEEIVIKKHISLWLFVTKQIGLPLEILFVQQ